MVRIDHATRELIGVWLSQHSSGEYFLPARLYEFERQGEQIIVYASKNGHAVYPDADKHPSPSGNYLLFSWYLRNDTGMGGKSLDCAQRYQVISGPSVVEPSWVNYPYRWGPENTKNEITWDAAFKIIYTALGPLPWIGFAVDSILAVAVTKAIFWVFNIDDMNGPEGPKKKDQWNGKYD